MQKPFPDDKQLKIEGKCWLRIPSKVFSISFYMWDLIKIHQFFHKIFSRNQFLTAIKCSNSTENLQKMQTNSPKRGIVNITLYVKFDQSIPSQDNERKLSATDGWLNGQTDWQTMLKLYTPYNSVRRWVLKQWRHQAVHKGK